MCVKVWLTSLVFAVIAAFTHPQQFVPDVASLQPDVAQSEEPVSTAFPPADPLLQAEDIIGTWRYSFALFHFQFRADGTYRANMSLHGLVADIPEDSGDYTLIDGILTLVSGSDTRFCEPGDTGVYQMSLNAEGQLQFVVVDDACSTRRPDDTPQLFNRIRVEPDAPSLVIHQDSCQYFGPESVSAGMFRINVISVAGSDRQRVAGAVATLIEPATFEDLVAWTSSDPPPWVSLLAYREVNAGAYATLTTMVRDLPIYLVGVNAEQMLCAIGPITVTPR